MTASARSLGHSISTAVTATMMAGIICYMYYCTRRRAGPHFYKYGPTDLVFLASILIMADLVRHVLQDENIWPEPSSSKRSCASGSPSGATAKVAAASRPGGTIVRVGGRDNRVTLEVNEQLRVIDG